MKLLSHLENLQEAASSRGDYACQTRLLGLQTNVIMMMNKSLRAHSLSRMLKEVEEFC